MTTPPAIHCAHDRVADPVSLIPHPRNPNTHPESQIALLARIIAHQGWRSPIVVSRRSGFIIAGHGRLQAAQLLKLSAVPVNDQDFATEADEWAHLVADNRLAELAEIDPLGLKGLLVDLGGEGFEMDLTGFSPEPLAEAISFGVEPGTQDAEPQTDKANELAKKWGVETGQIWELGEHRLLCGDCTDVAGVTQLLNGQKVPLVFTDPPYNVASETTGFARNSYNKQMDRLMKSEWDNKFNPAEALAGILESISEDSSVYICTSHHLAPEIWAWAKEWADHYSYCVWSKPNPMPSLSKRHWTWSCELIAYATRGKHTFNFPTEGHALSVWELCKVPSCDLHPTMKPVEVPSRAINHSSRPGDLVYEPFSGSGTTLIACEQLKRKCRAIEINPGYVAVALQRWADATGKTPKLCG